MEEPPPPVPSPLENAPDIVLESKPIITTTEVPIMHTTVDVPVATTTEVPMMMSTTEVPMMTTTEVPMMTMTEVPMMTTTEVPMMSTTEVPMMTTTEIPMMTTTEVPMMTSTEIPMMTSTEIPMMTTTEVSIITTLEEPVPVATTTEVPMMSTTEVPMMASTEVITAATSSGVITTSIVDHHSQNICLLPKPQHIVPQPSQQQQQRQQQMVMDMKQQQPGSNQLEQQGTNRYDIIPKQQPQQDLQQMVVERPAALRKPPPEKFIHEGCMYNFISYSKNRKYKFWRCDKRSQGCKVRIHTDSQTNKIVKIRNIHNHDNDPKDVELKRLKAIVKVRALQVMDNPAQVIKQSLNEVPNGPFELNAIQKRNLAKVINRERSLASMTVHAEAPSIVEEGHGSSTDENDEIDDVIPDEDNPEPVHKVLVEFNGELSDEDFGHSADTPNWYINIDTDPSPYIKMEPDDCYSPLGEKKPKEKLIEGGCMYAFDRHSTDGRVKFWRCDHRAHGCAVRLHTDAITNEIVKQVNMHNHDIDSRDVEIKKLKQTIKRKALETDDDPWQVIEDCTTGLSPAARAIVNSRNLEVFIHRHRRTSVARDPPRFENLKISLRYSTYSATPRDPVHAENFLLHDCGPDAGMNRILVFGRESNVRDAGSEENNIKHVIFDGTFSLTPPIYRDGKLYIVMIRQDEWIFPFLYVLLPNKSPYIYERFFTILRDLLPHLHPTTVSIDFDPDAFQSLTKAFPDAQATGHFFHFAQAVKRQWLSSSPEQHRRYCEDAEFAVLCKAVASIALVPIPRIHRALCDLRHNLPNELKFLVDWLEEYFTGKVNGEHQTGPVFPMQMWNAYDRFLADADSTELADTNAEAAHRRIQTELGMNHSTVWKLIDAFRKVQRTHDAEFDMMITGQRPPTQPKKFRSAYATMHKIVRSETDVESDADVWPYMRDLSRIFEVLP